MSPARHEPRKELAVSKILTTAPDDKGRLQTAHEVAERLGVPVSWVRDHTRQGRIPHLRLGRYVRYRRETVDKWLEEQRR
jgi:excisionase family DNA binding protein